MGRREPGVAGAALLVLAATACQAPGNATSIPARPAPERRITALGRLEPRDGVIRVAGPSRPSVVIAELLVAEGERVAAEQPLAVLDTRAENAARVARAEAELANATTERARVAELFRRAIAAAALRDTADLRVAVARAELEAARAALTLDTVRAPASGQVIAVHARSGERVGAEGVLELAQNDQMYAVAEVYETDAGRVKAGGRATVESPALLRPLAGTVERIGLHVGKQDVLDTDPVEQADARVVEVWIRLDDSAEAAVLARLQVEIVIDP